MFVMGSTGPDFVCPWCGRKEVGGYAMDGINYPICSEPDLYSCLDLVLEGISKNGVRAGALYHILRHESFRKIHAANPNFLLELCDYMFGTREEPRSPLHRWTKWNDHYIRRMNVTVSSAGMSRRLEASSEGEENEQQV